MTRSARRPQRKSIGPYEIVAELAPTGALGAVWLGSASAGPRCGEPLLFRRIADAAIGEAIERLADAARWATILNHDALLHVEGVERDDDELVIVSDYVEGDLSASLLRLAAMQRKPLPVDIALRLTSDVLAALSYLHGERHGEAPVLAAPSPEAIWIGADGRARLFEPSLHALAADEAPWCDHARRASYDAPERFDGGADPRSDVFSVGVVLWEMLRNRRLFAGESIEVVRERVQGAAIRRVDALAPAGGEPIDAALADVVARALAHDPAERFANAEVFAEALAAFPQAEPWDVSSFLHDLFRDELAHQRRLVDEVVRAGPSEPPVRSVRRPGALISPRPPAPILEDESPTKSFDEALIVSPDSFSPTSTPREALDSFESLVAAEGMAREADDDDFDALGLAFGETEEEEPPESERRLRTRALEILEEASPDEPGEPPPESGRRRASSAAPESGRRRASGAYLEVPASVSAPPLPTRRGVAPMVVAVVVAVLGIVVGAIVLRSTSAPNANDPVLDTPDIEPTPSATASSRWPSTPPAPPKVAPGDIQ